MVETAAAPKKHLVLETDWTSALGMGLLFLFSCLAVAVKTRNILRGAVSLEPIAWQTWLLLGMAAYVFLSIRPSEYRKTIRIVTVLVAIGPGSRIALGMLHASEDTQLANVAFVHVINDLIFVCVCLYVLWWFKSRIRWGC
jgi:hypothetical protein